MGKYSLVFALGRSFTSGISSLKLFVCNDIIAMKQSIYTNSPFNQKNCNILSTPERQLIICMKTEKYPARQDNAVCSPLLQFSIYILVYAHLFLFQSPFYINYFLYGRMRIVQKYYHTS